MITLHDTEILPPVVSWMVSCTRTDPDGHYWYHMHNVWGRTEAEARANHERRVAMEHLELDGYQLEFTRLPNY
jgi:hypothetical protein